MAKRRRSISRTRDTLDITNQRLRSFISEPVRSHLQMLEDRREYHPLKPRPAKAVVRSSTRLVVPNVKKPVFRSMPSPAVSFAVPKHVAICVRRKARREVILAGGYGGRRRQRKPRWSEYSQVRCR